MLSFVNGLSLLVLKTSFDIAQGTYLSMFFAIGHWVKTGFMMSIGLFLGMQKIKEKWFANKDICS